MCTWKLDTPCTVPAGARISAGYSGNVDRSLPNAAETDVNRSPVSCMPSPESPAKRTTTRSSLTVSPVLDESVARSWAVSVICSGRPPSHSAGLPSPSNPYGSGAIRAKRGHTARRGRAIRAGGRWRYTVLACTSGMRRSSRRRAERTDHEVYRDELRLADLAEPLGFESIWGVEHHFTDYTMCPDVLQFLTYMAGRTTTVHSGRWSSCCRGTTRCVWPSRSRCSTTCRGGRVISAWAGGSAGSSSRASGSRWTSRGERFVEAAEMILAGLEHGYVKYEGTFFSQPQREICVRRRSSRSRAAATPRRSRRSRARSWPSSASAS